MQTMAIQYLHDNGIVHNDTRPSNIFIVHTGHCVLGNFSRASLITDSLEWDVPSVSRGDLVYLAPEIFFALKPEDDIPIRYTQIVDWWSLGITLLEACAVPLAMSVSSGYVDSHVFSLSVSNLTYHVFL